VKLTRNSIGAILQDDSHPVFTSAIEDIEVEEGIADHVLTDPPYDDRTQSRVRHGKKTRTTISGATELGFDAATAEKRVRWARWIATATRRWAGVFCDFESSGSWRIALEAAGLVYVRPAIWIRTGDELLESQRIRKSGAPQFTGDRPPTGFEVIILAHKGRRMSWNGNFGVPAIYTHPVVRGAGRTHAAQKPIGLMLDLLRDFAKPGDVIADPFTGSGTTQVAAKQLGMRSLGIELQPAHADYARRRIAAARAGHHKESRT
jgi:site-specific DNA-methyltransferase (adenine-specific)